MKIVKSGSQYQIFGNDLETFEKLPVLTYRINFNPMSGYSLVHTTDLEIREKVYGEQVEKTKKIFNAFNSMARSLGVMMSGDKGIGKSLFTQILASEAIKRGIPVIVVTNNTPSLQDFLMDIKQEVLILFDEFEKVFDKEDQMRMLGLFDGLNMSKHLYVLTVNDLKNVNSFMLNRTGRIHYHLRFGYPTPDEIRDYLKDKVKEEYHNHIDSVVMFSFRMKLNYDLLRAIAFELNTGLSLKEALPDLNILNVSETRYEVQVFVEGLTPFIVRNERMDLFGEFVHNDMYSTFHILDNVVVRFEPKDLIYSNNDEGFTLSEDALKGTRIFPESSRIKNTVTYLKALYAEKYGLELSKETMAILTTPPVLEITQESVLYKELEKDIDKAFATQTEKLKEQDLPLEDKNIRYDAYDFLHDYARDHLVSVMIRPSMSDNYNVHAI